MFLKNVFSRLKRAPKSPNEASPKRVFQAIQVSVPYAVGRMTERFPWSSVASLDDRTLFFTTAFVYAVSLDLKVLQVSEERRSALRKSLLEEFQQWHPGAHGCIKDCNIFMEREQARYHSQGRKFRRQQFERALGFWTLSNCTGRQVTAEEERSAADIVGGYIFRVPQGCWKV